LVDIIKKKWQNVDDCGSMSDFFDTAHHNSIRALSRPYTVTSLSSLADYAEQIFYITATIRTEFV